MKAIEELQKDHEIILSMLSGIERLASTILTTKTVDADKVRDMIEFSRSFTDGYHHTKEEKHYFVRLQDRGMPKDQGPIAVMLMEHQMGRDLVRVIESALNEYQSGQEKSSESITQAILRYVQLLKAHIAKENNILFPMSERFLSTEDQQYLEESFKNINEHELGEDINEKYVRLAHKISGQEST